MAFPLFPKLPGKDKRADARAKPELSPRHDARPIGEPVSARAVAAAAKGHPPSAVKLRASPAAVDAREREITVTGPPSLIDWKPPVPGAQPSIEVAEANPGLCSVLENAALLYASGHVVPARQVLEQGVATDNDAKVSPLAWLALFDLLQRTDDRTAFERLALQYVVAFERSAPAWEEREREPQVRPGARPAPGGYFALSGKLSPANVPQIGHMLAATQKQPHVRLDLGSLTGADDAGAKLLADALTQLRKRQYALVLQHPEKIQRALEASVAQGRGAGEGYWMLLLEMLQWQNDRKGFEDRAVDFAVAFELSPPSWEPPPSAAVVDTTADAPASAAEALEMLCWQGTMIGPTDPQVAKFAEFREGRNTVPIDMSAVERIDFVCAGALLNAIIRAEGQRKTVQIAGASPIIRALLLLIGISPRHFIRKPQ